MSESNPFGAALPPGYTVTASGGTGVRIWMVWSEKGELVTAALIDQTIPLPSHIRYVWSRFYGEALGDGR